MTKRPSRYPPWIKLQMETLSPNGYFIIPPHVTSTLNPTNFRNMVSNYNRRYNTNLKFHRSLTGWWVWYCPDAKLLYPEEKLALVAQAQSLNNQLLSYMDNNQFDNAALVQTQLDKVKMLLSSSVQGTDKGCSASLNASPSRNRNTSRKVYHSKGSITQPLQRILSHLKLTAAQFARIHPREQIKLRISASVQITHADSSRSASPPSGASLPFHSIDQQEKAHDPEVSETASIF
jgi:hypothetical protein